MKFIITLGLFMTSLASFGGQLVDGMPVGTNITFVKDYELFDSFGRDHTIILLNDGKDLTERWCFLTFYSSTKINKDTTYTVTSASSSSYDSKTVFEELMLGNESQPKSYTLRCVNGLEAENVVNDIKARHSDLFTVLPQK